MCPIVDNKRASRIKNPDCCLNKSDHNHPKPDIYYRGHLEKPAPLAFRGALRGVGLLREGLTINGLRYRRSCSLPPTPHPVDVFRGALRDLSIGVGG